MNATSRREIVDLIINNKERNHQGRNRHGFHVYISRYFYDFNLLSDDEKRLHITRNLGITFGAPDDESIDSTNSLMFQKVRHQDVMKVACFNWSRLQTKQFKEAWCERALCLNERKLPGKFVVVPDKILNKRRGG